MRSKFYSVPEDSYLFKSALVSSDERKRPEEPVRQWCAFELMRTYGISVVDLEFERPVKVGSKTYSIDIAVCRDGDPWLIVECKKPSHQNHKSALEQALSYANVETVKAEFVVYTNGDTWLVKRRVAGSWIGVPDLPIFGPRTTAEPIVFLLGTLKELQPLLFQLGEQTSGKVAQRYMDAMQRFFNGTNLITQSVDRDLLHATDNLLRVLGTPAWDLHYRMSKTSHAYAGLEKYVREKQLNALIPPFGDSDDLQVEMLHLHAALMSTVEHLSDQSSADILVLRLNVALTEYGMRLGLSGQTHPSVEPHLHQALYAFLEYGLKVHLNISLPDPLDRIWNADIRNYCRNAWETFDDDPVKVSSTQLLLALLQSPFKRLMSWMRNS